MTLSNKILIVFFGIILAYTLMAFVEIRVSGETRNLNDENSISETIELDGVTYVVIEEGVGHWINMSASTTPRLEMKSKSGDVLSKLDYRFENDTLYIHRMEEVEHRFALTIYIPKSGFTGIRSTGTYLQLSSIAQKKLSISQASGKITLGTNVDLEHLSIVATVDAMVDMMDARVDTMALQINASNLRLFGDKVRRLEGSLENNAALYANNITEIQLKKDEESTIRIMN